jgi:hypothetical protein
MNKKKFIATIIFLAFLVIPCFGVQFFRAVQANPLPIDTTSPNLDPPILAVQSPTNITYLTNDISLNFTVAKPSSWGDSNTMREISYTLDGQNNPLWISSVGKDAPDPSFPALKELSAILTGIADGQHTLKVDVTAQSRYFPNPNFFFASYSSFGASQTIMFLVNNSSSNMPSPTPNFTINPTSSHSPSQPTTSPTYQSILEPTQSPNIANVWGNNILWYFIGGAAIAFVVLFIFFLSRRKD